MQGKWLGRQRIGGTALAVGDWRGDPALPIGIAQEPQPVLVVNIYEVSIK